MTVSLPCLAADVTATVIVDKDVCWTFVGRLLIRAFSFGGNKLSYKFFQKNHIVLYTSVDDLSRGCKPTMNTFPTLRIPLATTFLSPEPAVSWSRGLETRGSTCSLQIKPSGSGDENVATN